MKSLSDLLSQEDASKESFLQKQEQSLKNLRIADLEIILTAARMGHLGKAASAHHLSQSAASSAVQRVEAAFQVPLCMHERRQFRLTRQGQMLLPQIEEVITKLRSFICAKKEPAIRLVTTHAIAQIAVPFLLPLASIEFQHKRPDQAYKAIIEGKADIALVLDNFPWKGVVAAEVGRGHFQLYCRQKSINLQPVLLPEDQMEVLFLQQSWLQIHGYSLPIQARIPSWSLIAQICSKSDAVGFLPDFLGQAEKLHPVVWQPASSPYRILAIYRGGPLEQQERFSEILQSLQELFDQVNQD